MVDDRRIISMVKRTCFVTGNQVSNTLQEVGVSISKSTIKRKQTKSCCRKEENQHLVMSVSSRLQAVIPCKVLELNILLAVIFICPITFMPMKGVDCVEKLL